MKCKSEKKSVQFLIFLSFVSFSCPSSCLWRWKAVRKISPNKITHRADYNINRTFPIASCISLWVTKKKHKATLLKHWKVLKKKKKLPPLRAAETRPAWFRQLAVASLTDASSAKWRHVKSREVYNKFQLQPAAVAQPKAPKSIKSKRQEPSDQPGAPCAAGCPVFSELCVVSVQLGLSDTRRPTCTPLCVEVGVGYSRSAHWASGWSWDPAAEVETQAGSSVLTLTSIGWECEVSQLVGVRRDDPAVRQETGVILQTRDLVYIAVIL